MFYLKISRFGFILDDSWVFFILTGCIFSHWTGNDQKMRQQRQLIIMELDISTNEIKPQQQLLHECYLRPQARRCYLNP